MNSLCMPPLSRHPLVSIFLNIRNGERTVRRCLEGVLNQNYQNLEFIIQDGASTDRTLEIVQSYRDQRISLVSEPDGHSEIGFVNALQRCHGDIIGSSMADEELLPDAVEWALEQFQKHPDAGGIYGQAYTTDMDGAVRETFTPKHPFTLQRYLGHEVVPCFAASFFRGAVLAQALKPTRSWPLGCGEFPLWVWMGQLAPIYYEPGIVTKYAVHAEARSSSSAVMEQIIARRPLFLAQWFDEPEITAEQRSWKSAALGGMFLWAAQSMMGCGNIDHAVQYTNRAAQYESPFTLLNEVMFNLFALGIAAVRQGNLKEAIQCLNIADGQGCRFPHVYLARSLCHLRNGNIPAAIGDWSKELNHHALQSDLSSMLVEVFKNIPADYFPAFPVQDAREPSLAPATPVASTVEVNPAQDLNLIALGTQVGERMGRQGPLTEDEIMASMNALQCLIDAPSLESFLRQQEMPTAIYPLVQLLKEQAQAQQNNRLVDSLSRIQMALIQFPADAVGTKKTTHQHL